MIDSSLLFVVHAFGCFAMTGIIWLVQTLVYPNFRLLNASDFSEFHNFHSRRITWVVAPLMGLELSTGVLLGPVMDYSVYWIMNLTSVLLTWGLTGLLNVPSHNKLKAEDPESKNRLILLNWPRLVVWSIRTAWVSWLLLLNMNG